VLSAHPGRLPGTGLVEAHLQVRILGPLELNVGGGWIRPGPQQSALLAALVLEADRVVPAQRLIDLLWGEPVREGAAATLRSHVAHLRRVLQPGRANDEEPALLTEAGGYRLRVARDQVDAFRFERLVHEGREALASGDPMTADSILRDALDLWRGPALAGLADRPFALRPAARLERLRQSAEEARLEAALAAGRHAEIVAELEGLVAERPTDELLRRQLAVALYRSQRQEEATRVCRDGLRLLADQGLDAPELQELQRDILRRAPELARPGPERPAPVYSFQLLPDVAGFIGREAELSVLCNQLAGGGPTRVVVIAGPPGVGKSALALHAAHRHAERFPGGQLYANLHGSSAGVLPLEPGEVLVRFLRSLGVESRHIPSQVEEQAALFRSLLMDRRVLVVLDDAVLAEQVRPLLPAGRGSAVLVTSRRILSGLDGAVHLQLGPLSIEAAVDLLAQLAGHERIAADQAAAAAVARLCDALPLALRISGSRLAARPNWPLGALAERLADEQARLDELQTGDLAVRTSFQVAYEALPASAAQAFRMLGLVESPDIALEAAASLLDQPARVTEAVLERLVDTCLLESPAPGRYRFHDLLRLFARQCAERVEPPAVRRAALARLFGFHLSRGRLAERLLRPGDPDDCGRNEQPQAAGFPDRTAALAWLDREHANLVATVRQAATQPEVSPGLCWQLAEALFTYLDLRGLWVEMDRVNQLALEASERQGDVRGQAAAHRALGAVNWRQYRLAKARSHLERGLELFRTAGSQRGEAISLNGIGLVSAEQRDYEYAIVCYRRSLELFQRLHNRRGQSMALNNLGQLYTVLGRYREALDCLEQDLGICRQLDDRRGEAITLFNLGDLHGAQHRCTEAVRAYERSLWICRELGDRPGEGRNLSALGALHRGQGRLEDAVRCLRRACELLGEVGAEHPHGEALTRLGLALDALGDLTEARLCFQRALAVFERLDAPEAGQVRVLLHA
jgi:DNA-binding SARP family transcriptional activator/tetratricopeptide (TPR) repeat protein